MAPSGNGQPSTVGLQLPDIFQTINHENHSTPNFGFSKSPGHSTSTTQKRVHEVTKNLISIYKQKRMRVFHNMASTKAALRSKEFFRIYITPSEAIATNKIRFKSKFHSTMGKKKKFDYKKEYEKLRGLQESEEELAKVQAYIDKMIERNLRKMEEEKNKNKKKNEKNSGEEKSQYTTLRELVSILLILLVIQTQLLSNHPFIVKSSPRKDTRAKKEKETHQQ